MGLITLAPFPIRPPEPKKCCKCGKQEPEVEFYKGSSNKCKKCYKEDYKNKKKGF